jgi:hypothetical protein
MGDFSSLVAPLRHQNVENTAVLINGSPQVHLSSMDLDEDLIDEPDISQTTLFLFESLGVLCSGLQTRETNGFVRNNDATLCQQLLNIPKAESEAMVVMAGEKVSQSGRFKN